MDDAAVFYSFMLPVTLLAGFVRGLSGFGGPLILIPSLQLFLPPEESVTITLLVDLIANLRLVPDAKRNASREVLWPLTVGGAVALPLGVLFLLKADPAIAKKVISVVLLLATTLMLFGWRLPRPLGRRGLLLAGALGGLSIGASGISVVISLALQAGRESAVSSRANFVVWACIFTIASVAMLLILGEAAAGAALSHGAALLPVYVGGVILGIVSYRRMAEGALRTATLLFAAATAIANLA